MKKYITIIFFIIWITPLYTQTYYDSNDLKYYLDFSNKIANLKFQEYKIKGPIEEINSFNGNRYTLIEGDSIHWLLQQSNSKNKYLSDLITSSFFIDDSLLASLTISLYSPFIIK